MASSSPMWKYFTKCGKNDVACNTCNKKLKSGGGTSNLKQHLQHKHPALLLNNLPSASGQKETPPPDAEFDVCLDVDDPAYNNDNDSDSVLMSPPRSSSGLSFTPSQHSRSPTPAGPPEKRQMTLFETSSRASSYERGGHRDVAITNSLIFMICRDNLPHFLVEKEGFTSFLKTTVPLYKVPSRKTVSNMVSMRYTAAVNKMQDTLQKVENISLTADMVTLSNTSRGFLVVTAHFLCPNQCTLESITLGVRRMSEAHTGDNIALEIESLLRLFDIPKKKVVSACTDGGANVVAAIRLVFGEGFNVHCLAHVLNLIVNDGIEDEKNEGLKALIDNVKKIVTFGPRSNLFMDALRAEQKKDNILEGNILLLIQSVPQRWNSVFYMIERFLKLYKYIAPVLANPNLKNAPRMLSGVEIEELSQITKVLAPFEQATKEISGSEYLTGSLVLPVISCVETAFVNLAHTITSETSRKLRQVLLASLVKRCQPLRSNPLLCKATLADPRFKKTYMLPTVASQAITDFGIEIRDRLKDLGQGSASPPNAAQGGERVVEDSIWAGHDKTVQISSTTVNIESVGTIPSELKLYLQQPLLPRSENAIAFWRQGRTLMTSLAYVSLKFLTVIGASVPSERLGSTLNMVVSDDRCRLTDDHITERVFLNRLNKKYWDEL